MSIRLGEYVLCGELWTTKRYGVHGYVALRGEQNEYGEHMALRLELTGTTAPDLRGKHIRFEPAADDGSLKDYNWTDFKKLSLSQNGPTGTMTTQGWVRALPCSVEEFVSRCKLGEAPPTPWRDRLMLEWFSQNGRVTVELAGATVEFCTREPDDDNEDDEGDWAPIENLALPPEMDPSKQAGPSITRFEVDDDSCQIDTIRPVPLDVDDEEDGDDFQATLDAETRRVDRAIRGESDEAVDGLDALKRMDYCLEHGETVSLSAFIGNFNELPKPESLDDEAIEGELKALLARMVMHGVVLDVCEHFSPRDCYTLLLEKIVPEEGAYKELSGTGWAQHFSTWEYCKQCDEEFEKRFEAEARREQSGE